MKRFFVLLLFLLVSISAVSASDNITDSIGDVDDDFQDNVILSNMTDVEASDNISPSEGNSSQDFAKSNQTEHSINIQAENLVWYYKANPVFKFKLVDENGFGIPADNVSISLNKKIYSVGTDETGSGSLPVKLSPGTYPVNIFYGNHSITKSIKLFSSRVTQNKDITTNYGNKAQYKVKLVKNSGEPMAGIKVTFKLASKVYIRWTDSRGCAILNLNSKAGKYSLRYSAGGFSGKNVYTVKNRVSLKILHWGLKGDVRKAPLIKKCIPNNPWVKKAVAATKKGIPLLTIKGGNGKVVFLTAGVHGNELNSQVAAMKMIRYLTTHPIRGTVHIIPFVNVKAISQKVRLTDYDFNRVAHIQGTVSNKITKLISKCKCDAYGDFHTTVSPGVPGINVVLGYTSPSKCIPLTKYIAKHSNVHKIFYYPGQKYTWSLADWVNHKGTPAVICEVISPVNKVSAKATGLSYREMTSFLNYNRILR